MRKQLLTFLILTIALIACGEEKGPAAGNEELYLNQAPPADTPKVFAPGIVSTGMNERDITFTPQGDALYYTVRVNGGSAIIETKLSNGFWIKPEVAKFSGRYIDMEPHITPDGMKFLFISNRPLSDTSETPDEHFNLWQMDLADGAWTSPRPFEGPVNGKGDVYYPSTSENGNLYFTRRLEDGSEAIYRSRFSNGGYEEPVRLPDNVNTTNAQFNAFISPDESFLIIPVWGRKDTEGSSDYYITFRNENDEWTDLVNMGKLVNSQLAEYAPSLSPDGKYLFFQKNRTPVKQYDYNMTYSALKTMFEGPENGNSDIYWVDAAFINKLKTEK